MNVYRSDTTLRIEIPETDEVVEVSFPNTVRVCYGTKRYEIVGLYEGHLMALMVKETLRPKLAELGYSL